MSGIKNDARRIMLTDEPGQELPRQSRPSHSAMARRGEQVSIDLSPEPGPGEDTLFKQAKVRPPILIREENDDVYTSFRPAPPPHQEAEDSSPSIYIPLVIGTAAVLFLGYYLYKRMYVSLATDAIPVPRPGGFFAGLDPEKLKKAEMFIRTAQEAGALDLGAGV